MDDLLKKAVHEAIRTLPPIARLVVRLRLQGVSIRQCARRLGMARSTVEHHYCRVALPLLRRRVPRIEDLLRSRSGHQ